MKNGQVTAEIEIHEGHGPMHFTEDLASATHEGYTLQWQRIIPFGLKLWVTDKDGSIVRTVVFNQQKFMEDMATAALDDLANS